MTPRALACGGQDTVSELRLGQKVCVGWGGGVCGVGQKVGGVGWRYVLSDSSFCGRPRHALMSPPGWYGTETSIM